MIANVKVFRPIDDALSTDKFIAGYSDVLKVYGVTTVTSTNSEWRYNPDNYIILFEDEHGDKALGGGRIQIFTPEQQLPIERAVMEKDPKIYDVIREYKYYETGEFCGLWNSKEVAGHGIGSIFLGQVSVAISTAINLKGLFALCSPPSLRNGLQTGFEVIRSLGNNGTFYYPKENLLATATILKDPINLSTAAPSHKEAILKLRNNPQQVYHANGPKGDLVLNCNLSITLNKR